MEHVGNKGYLAVKKEVTKGVIAAVPDVYIPFYEESMMTNTALDEDVPVIGNIFARFQSLLGLRSHGGDITFLAEPNTAGYIIDQILTKGSTTGSAPYTHPFTLSPVTNPNAYTMDIRKGKVVARFLGCEISELGINFDKNKMTFGAKVHALKSFIVREVASVSGSSNPYTIVLKTDYDASPTDGLIVGDTMTAVLADNTTVNFTVASIVDGTSITTSTDITTAVAGSLIFIRAATPSYTLKAPFEWAKTEFRFDTTAADALTEVQTRVEQGSAWTLMYKFEADEGAQRSGSRDPAALVRMLGDIEVTVKQIFDNPWDMNRYLANLGGALVIRHFSEGSTYELRVTINKFKLKENPTIVKSGEVVYSEATLIPDYNTGDGQAFDIKVINNVATI